MFYLHHFGLMKSLFVCRGKVTLLFRRTLPHYKCISHRQLILNRVMKSHVLPFGLSCTCHVCRISAVDRNFIHCVKSMPLI